MLPGIVRAHIHTMHLANKLDMQLQMETTVLVSKWTKSTRFQISIYIQESGER
jgi:hypothetical protein